MSERKRIYLCLAHSNCGSWLKVIGSGFMVKDDEEPLSPLSPQGRGLRFAHEGERGEKE